MYRPLRSVTCAALLALSACAGLCPFCDDAEPARNVRVAAIFSDGMVLQRDRPIPVWGQAEPGGEVIVTLSRPDSGEKLRSARATVNAQGCWEVRLPAVPCHPTDRGSYTLAVHGTRPILFKDVLVGDVWLCSGQSNMEWPLSRVADAEREIASAGRPQMRLLTIPRRASPVPQREIETDGWVACSPQTVTEFSAVGYLFGRELQEHLGIPIGLINSSWGGTPAEAWTSPEGLSRLSDYREDARLLASLPNQEESSRQAILDEAMGAWRDAVRQADRGFLRQDDDWLPAPIADDAPVIELPGLWSGTDLAAFDGSVWFSRDFEAEAAVAAHDAVLHLGPIDDQDEVFINGVRVGATLTPGQWQTARRYPVPAGTIHTGRNTIWIRVIDTGGEGGLSGAAEALRIESGPGAVSIMLQGPWRYRRGLEARAFPPAPRLAASPSHRPAHLFNGMVAPLIPFAIRGAIWYQGESNASRAYQYRSLFSEMIRDWRRHWGEGDFPFLFVQLANFMPRRDQPTESAWAELREAQAMALSLPATGMAVTIDIGEANNIHPRNKQDVGRRLALAARHIAYDEEMVDSGPIYRSMEIEEGAVRISFDRIGSGLLARGGELTGFAIAGDDQRFYWAEGRIEGDSVVLRCPEVRHPVAARYAWADNPAASLINAEGLPAGPFRTDDWPGVTAGKR